MEMFALVFFFCRADPVQAGQCGYFAENMWFETEQDCVSYFVNQTTEEATERGFILNRFMCVPHELPLVEGEAL